LCPTDQARKHAPLQEKRALHASALGHRHGTAPPAPCLSSSLAPSISLKEVLCTTLHENDVGNIQNNTAYWNEPPNLPAWYSFTLWLPGSSPALSWVAPGSLSGTASLCLHDCFFPDSNVLRVLEKRANHRSPTHYETACQQVTNIYLMPVLSD
jgi:hypothetical protein